MGYACALRTQRSAPGTLGALISLLRALPFFLLRFSIFLSSRPLCANAPRPTCHEPRRTDRSETPPGNSAKTHAIIEHPIRNPLSSLTLPAHLTDPPTVASGVLAFFPRDSRGFLRTLI